MIIEQFIKQTLAMPPLRQDIDFFENESSSLICLDLLLNQRIGVERATAVAISIHDHFGRPLRIMNNLIANVTIWPYKGIELRNSAKPVFKIVDNYFEEFNSYEGTSVSDLPSHIIGALASLERYYNRGNDFFNLVRKVELTAAQIRTLNIELVFKISNLKLPEDNLRKQLLSVAKILEMKNREFLSIENLREELIKLERVGDETADTLLIYLFNQPALIIDEYLRRITYRHFLIEKPNCSRKTIIDLFDSYIKTREEAHRLHARLNEIGSMYCNKNKPNCDNCPFGKHDHRL